LDDAAQGLNSFIDANIEKLLDLSQNVPAIALLLLLLTGLIYVVFGLKIYKIILCISGFVLGGLAAYHLTENVLISFAVGAGVAVLAAILQFLFMLVVAGLTFGAMAFAGMMVYFHAHLSLLAGIGMAIVGIYAAVKLFRFIIIVTTSAIGSAAAVFSALVLKDHGGILGEINLMEAVVDDFQMITGFAGLLLVGVIVQGISWGRSKDEKEA
jgi:hypothetical protein